MLKKHNTFNVFYLLIITVNIYALFFENELVRMIAMPSIAISLMIYLIIKTKVQTAFHKLVFAGLVFSLAGDVQLLFSTSAEFYLLTALLATLVSYMLYSAAYYLDFNTNPGLTKRVGNILLVFLALITVSFFMAASKNLNDFKYPASAYLIVLTIMTVLSGYRHKRVNRVSFKLILTGSFAFVLSDLSIGYYHFIESENLMMMFFLLAYLIAQYLVVIGSIERTANYNSMK
ncbi:MAG TPA: lysoplasmalogenase family protein [Pedobacter sp.]|jgi:uncharacterized membrane protein YhhN